MHINFKKVYGYTVLIAALIAIAVGLSVSTGFWWAGLVFVAAVALIATAATCAFS